MTFWPLVLQSLLKLLTKCYQSSMPANKLSAVIGGWKKVSHKYIIETTIPSLISAKSLKIMCQENNSLKNHVCTPEEEWWRVDGVHFQLTVILTVAMTTFSSQRRTVWEDKLLTQEITGLGLQMEAVTLHTLKPVDARKRFWSTLY